MCLGQSNGLDSKLETKGHKFHLLLTPKFYEFVLYYCMPTNPNLAFGKYFVILHKKRERWLKWTRQTNPKKKKILIWFVRGNKNRNLVPDHRKKLLDLNHNPC